jgi:tetratricopeptide (TPR) repeat protein
MNAPRSSVLERIDQMCDQYEVARLAGQQPRIDDYLREVPEAERSGLLHELLRLEREYLQGEQRRRWLQGKRVFVQDYLEEAPSLQDYPELVYDLVCGEVLLRAEAGEKPQLADYIALVPAHQTQLRRFFVTCRLLPPERLHGSNEASTLREVRPAANGGAEHIGEELPTPVGETTPLRPASDLPFPGGALFERIGVGGMGEVYRCGDEALGRDLAIKVIKADLCGNKGVEQRFLREARITGSLQHPGIVPIHNLGRLADGRPWYTMKLVRGRTLADLLRDESKGPERLPHLLAIMEKVCQAVAYAHSKGIIHRDLKPSNVMVGKFGEVQVMDWGLAKVLSSDQSATKTAAMPEEAGTVIYTAPASTSDDMSRTGAAMGTPSYMPPEQAMGERDLVDERADVFALGAMMCELLTGFPPYRGSLREEVMRRTRRGDLAEALGRLERCGADAALLQLCRECLAPEREGRPRKADVVAKRLAAYQAEVQERLRQAELTAARAAVKAQEERKRRRWAVAFVLVLLAGIIGTSMGLVLSERLRGLAQEKEGEAEKEKAAALASQKQAMEALRATTDEVVEQLIGGKPALGPAEKAFLEQTLKRWQAFADAAGEGEQARAIRAEGVYRVAKLRSKLGQREEAVLGYQEAIALRRKLMDDFPGVPQHRQDLALTYSLLGHGFFDLGKQQERETALRQALVLREKLATDFPDEPEYRFDEANSHKELGWLLYNRGKYAGAESSYRRALALYDQQRGASPAVAKYRRDMAETHRVLGQLLMDQRKFAAAEAAHRQAIALMGKLVDEFPAVPDYRARLAVSHQDLGATFNHQGKQRETEASHRAALAIQEKLAADFPAVPDYQRDLALLYHNLGDSLRLQGKQEAETVVRQGLAIAEKLVAEFPTEPEYRFLLGMTQNVMGATILSINKEPVKALPWLDKGIATLEEALRRGGSIDRVQFGLRASHQLRADALSTLQRHADALKDFDKMVELAPEPERALRRSIRAVGRVRAGQVAAAIEETEELAKNAEPLVLYNAACVYALASVPTKANPISPKQQAKYAERAIALLRQVVAKGYHNVYEMKNDDDLKPLRQRDDFQKLLRDMQK